MGLLSVRVIGAMSGINSITSGTSPDATSVRSSVSSSSGTEPDATHDGNLCATFSLQLDRFPGPRSEFPDHRKGQHDPVEIFTSPSTHQPERGPKPE